MAWHTLTDTEITTPIDRAGGGIVLGAIDDNGRSGVVV